MRGFLRYLCSYCASRLMYDTMRALPRRPRKRDVTACHQHVSGVLVSLLLMLTCRWRFRIRAVTVPPHAQ